MVQPFRNKQQTLTTQTNEEEKYDYYDQTVGQGTFDLNAQQVSEVHSSFYWKQTNDKE